ncbi:helix-turn-helix domain-containing protein [Staphylococcus hominis]|uniref:helix-turn-helix domain-containing protein n=1 Tax=Staphylococcus hominis TaxID=1290 RepID=UPI00019FCE45|nr:helix-turn-helix transcriptional regulator [Staphylococcus hominis]EEK12866.1 DNA-binding helix-turn-helix protein [Staphylococcus hominis SK119]MCC3714405.1 helix-turn-helix domain-containing protein [Staphylococcus hominis]MCI2888586.1 helix-turn-helix domain-containing protein [Staphylococcus hominis]MCI2892086.1 helix-turn-helix domain-containing protein [Staphylococcus hominis]MDS3836800.1 helix-turn-helix transcriptional regulator [Staphylococcus hominis]
MKFGEILKNHRNSLNLSVNKLSKLSNVSVGYISKIENGKRNFPSIRTLFLLLVGFKNSKLSNQTRSIKDIDKEIKDILSEFICAEDSEIDIKELENIYNDFNTFYEDLNNDDNVENEKNRKVSVFVFEENENKIQDTNLKEPINDLSFHLNDNLNEKFFNGVLLNEYDKIMIKEIINSLLINKIKQEDIYLSEDIEQLQKQFNNFRKEALLNKKQLKMFANHNSLQSLKENNKNN